MFLGTSSRKGWSISWVCAAVAIAPSASWGSHGGVGHCAADADCDDGLFCNGPETCVLGECENAIQPCDENQNCDEANRACIDPTNPDGDDDDDEVDGTATACTYLGDDPRGKPDRDAFIIQGSAGETLNIELEAAEDGNGGEAKFILKSKNPHGHGHFKVRKIGHLPMQISATLPWDGEYRVVVKERHGTRRHPRTPYEGDFCVTLDSSGDASSTLTPAPNVESDSAD